MAISALPDLRSGREIFVRQEERVDPALREGIATEALVGKPNGELLARSLLKPAPDVVRVRHVALLRCVQHLLVGGMHRHLLCMLRVMKRDVVLLRYHLVGVRR